MQSINASVQRILIMLSKAITIFIHAAQITSQVDRLEVPFVSTKHC